MDKLVALKDYLEALKHWNPERIEVFIEEGGGDYSESYAGPDLLLYRHTYNGVIELDAAQGDIRDLLANVLVWINENGGENDSLQGYDGEPVDRKRTDITLRLFFEEEVHYIPTNDPQYAGKDKITVGGIDYKRGTQAADVADTLQGDDVGVTP